MSSTLESELNNLRGFFKRSTLTFEIRICKLHFRVTKTSLWRYANFTFYSTTITAAALFTRRDFPTQNLSLPLYFNDHSNPLSIHSTTKPHPTHLPSTRAT